MIKATFYALLSLATIWQLGFAEDKVDSYRITYLQDEEVEIVSGSVTGKFAIFNV